VKTPAFKPHLLVEVIPGEGIVILSEGRTWIWEGPTFEKIAPLIDGCRTADEIVDSLTTDSVDALSAFHALGQLEASECVAEASAQTSHPFHQLRPPLPRSPTSCRRCWRWATATRRPSPPSRNCRRDWPLATASGRH